MLPTKDSHSEITVKAVILGIILSCVLAGANAYLGLFAGMTVSASIPAAVISMGIFRFFKRHSILENNLVQTAASAGESVAAGVIFTLPALILLGYWTTFNYWETTFIAAVGGMIGVLFSIPLRRSLIVKTPLKFPEGVATAEILKSGSAGSSGVKLILYAGIIGAVFKFLQSGLKLWRESLEGGKLFDHTVFYFGTNLSPALLAVGYIIGLPVAVLVFAGGVIGWLIGIPLYSFFYGTPSQNPVEAAWIIWSHQIRYIGVGAMVIGGLWALINLWKPLMSGISIKRPGAAPKWNKDVNSAKTEKDIPFSIVLVLLVLFIIPVFFFYHSLVGKLWISIPMTIVMVFAGFLFSAVAAYMAGLVGSSNNPISGITIATILFSSLLLVVLMGKGSLVGPAAAILIGAVVCCAAAIAGDNMQDLKAGHLLGATPWKQQVMQGIGTLSAAFVLAPILMLLLNAYGIGGEPTELHPNPLKAPQATLMQSVARGVFLGGLPWEMIFLGGLTAILIIAFDKYQERKGASFRTPVLAVAVGIYLPLELTVPIFLGGFIQFVSNRISVRKNSGGEGRGLLFASGLITGEALLGIFLAIPIVIYENPDVMAVFGFKEWQGIGFILFLIVAALLFMVSSKDRFV